MGIISAVEQTKYFLNVKGLQMAFVEIGTGDPIVFLHGNPTSSYLWRNIIPYLENKGRCLAPDLIGMGDSDKLEKSGPDCYRFIEHREYLDLLLEELNVGSNVTLILHDWGSALGFDWARRHPDRIKGIAYMEAVVCPMKWDDFNQQARGVFEGFRSTNGDKMVLEKNVFVERILPGSILRALTEEEMAVYRRPYLDIGESRRPTLTWPREIPLDGKPQDVVKICNSYASWLSKSDVPKLFINADPGAILIGPQREFCRSWPNQREVTVKGIHFIQEDAPHKIGQAIAEWISSLPQYQ